MNGQEIATLAGEIAKRGDIGGDPDVQRGAHLDRPGRYFSNHAEGSAIYTVATAAEDRFEAGLAEAKAEGNLSRANVVRKVTGRPRPLGKRLSCSRSHVYSLIAACAVTSACAGARRPA